MSTSKHASLPAAQRGMALVAALFMIIVVAAFGVFAMRIGANQQQTANLELLEHRAFAVANSGLEQAATRARAGACVNTNFAFNSFTVTVTCRLRWSQPWDYSVVGPPSQVYALEATARHGVYGTPDFVQRTLRRRVSNIPPESWN